VKPVGEPDALIGYKKQIGDIYKDLGRGEDAAAARASAQKLIADAYAMPNLTAQSRALLDQFSYQPPEERCASEARFKSSESIFVTQVKFVNRASSPIRLHWLDLPDNANCTAPSIRERNSRKALTALILGCSPIPATSAWQSICPKSGLVL
jgi:hypothetical protein